MNRLSRIVSTLTVLSIIATVGLAWTVTVQAGSLNPAPVPRTGQTTGYVAGDDGALQAGVDWPDPRFTDNEDGTVTDLLTGLVWLKDATRFTARAWNPALAACNGLMDDGTTLTDLSLPGDWRLPNNRELRLMIDFGNSDPALPAGHPFIVPASGAFWTSTTAMNNLGRAWTIEDGAMVNDPKGTPNYVWPVRDPMSGELGPAPVPRTGQTISYGNRDDGELQKGVEWNDPRFTDNGDGTVTDNLTALIWLKDATQLVNLRFGEALEACNNLADDGVSLTDGSVAGDWRLANILELGSLSDFSQIGPAMPPGHPFVTGGAATYWSSTTMAGTPNRAWTVGTGIGRIIGQPKNSRQLAWPVRDPDRVYLDIKPGSCPNPINVKSRGKTPVALLGSSEFDVTAVDPVTVRLGGVAPIRSSIEDVTTPFGTLTGKYDCDLDCWDDEDEDGYPDLTLKFDTRELVAALGDVSDEECRTLTLTGNLTEAHTGAPFEAEDVVRIDDEGADDDEEEDDGGGGRRYFERRRTNQRLRTAPGNDDLQAPQLK